MNGEPQDIGEAYKNGWMAGWESAVEKMLDDSAVGRAADLRRALDDLLAAFSRMPDAGLDSNDPRWRWWHDTTPVRFAARKLLEASPEPNNQ